MHRKGERAGKSFDFFPAPAAKVEEAISRLSRGESNFLYAVYYARAEVKGYNGLIAVFQLLGGREKAKEISGSLIGSV